MGWKGTLRSMQAAARRAEREAARRQRGLEKQRREIEKMEARARAAYEVQLYEARVDRLLTVHHEVPSYVDWNAILESTAPGGTNRTNEDRAKKALYEYEPSVADRLMMRTKKKTEALGAAAREARLTDEEAELQHDLAQRVIANDPAAFTEAIKALGSLAELSDLGEGLALRFTSNLTAVVELQANEEHVIPTESKTLLTSGGLSTKKLSASKFNDLFQDHICGAALRVGNEVMAALPVRMTIVTAVSRVLDTSTGHKPLVPILSVALPRETLEDLNLARVDPSDSMKNFVHNMRFKKTQGFSPVEALDPNQFESP